MPELDGPRGGDGGASGLPGLRGVCQASGGTDGGRAGGRLTARSLEGWVYWRSGPSLCGVVGGDVLMGEVGVLVLRVGVRVVAGVRVVLQVVAVETVLVVRVVLEGLTGGAGELGVREAF